LLWPFRSSQTRATKNHSSGLKLCLLPAAAMIGASGTTPDPGVWIMAICGLLYTLSRETYSVAPDPQATPAFSFEQDQLMTKDA
jgi:hypothetical protein